MWPEICLTLWRLTLRCARSVAVQGCLPRGAYPEELLGAHAVGLFTRDVLPCSSGLRSCYRATLAVRGVAYPAKRCDAHVCRVSATSGAALGHALRARCAGRRALLYGAYPI